MDVDYNFALGLTEQLAHQRLQPTAANAIVSRRG
jgi:hypothetical protein